MGTNGSLTCWCYGNQWEPSWLTLWEPMGAKLAVVGINGSLANWHSENQWEPI